MSDDQLNISTNTLIHINHQSIIIISLELFLCGYRKLSPIDNYDAVGVVVCKSYSE